MNNKPIAAMEGKRPLVIVLSIGPEVRQTRTLIVAGLPIDVNVTLEFQEGNRELLVPSVLLTMDQLRQVADGINNFLAESEREAAE